MLYSSYSGLVCGSDDVPQGKPDQIEKVKLLSASQLDDLYVHCKKIAYIGNRHGTQSLYGKYFMLFDCSGTANIVVSDTCAEFDSASYIAAIEIEIA